MAPLAGREFNPAEDVAGGPMAVILSQKLWRRTFHSNPAIVDSRVLLRGEPHTVVGIMPESLADTADLWAPLRPSTTGEGGGTNYVILARASEQVVRRFVFGITSTDLLTFAAASIGIILIAVVASLAPAVRVSRIDPARSLRQE